MTEETIQDGATENAGVEKSARSKMQGVEKAGVETSGKIDTAECYAGVCKEKNG